MASKKNAPIKVRSTVARQAYERNGAGTHRSNLPKRQRTRAAQLRAAVND